MFKQEKSGILSNLSYRRTGILACSSILLLFLLGGLVRVTGSGMGCPDWPRCFGMMAPPTCACQLPSNYQQIFLEKRIKKVERFAKMMDKFGFHHKANQIRQDQSILLPEEFNAAKAWIEYINRIFGVLAGIFSLAFVVIAIAGRQKPAVILFSLLGLLFLVINAWIGSIVVATNLLPGLVSVHFLFSFLCVFMFIMAMHRSMPLGKANGRELGKGPMISLLLLLFVEIFLGTMAREMVEVKVAQHNLVLEGMLDFKGMGFKFAIHRFLPAAIFCLSALYAYRFRSMKWLKNRFIWVAALAFIQICFGAFNIVFVLPAVPQVGHIVLGSIMPVLIFYYILTSRSPEITA